MGVLPFDIEEGFFVLQAGNPVASNFVIHLRRPENEILLRQLP